jgi:hypothetical protein
MPAPRPVDFGNAEFEPSDDDLHELSHEAFADVDADNQRALQKLRDEITKLRADAVGKKKR